MKMNLFEEKLLEFNTTVYFSNRAYKDFKRFSKGMKNQILLLILKQVQKGADFKPIGNGNKLNPPLHQFAKIKSKATSLRIVYRPVFKAGKIEMQIIAIGPRDRSKVYDLAINRLVAFFNEVEKRKE